MSRAQRDCLIADEYSVLSVRVRSYRGQFIYNHLTTQSAGSCLSGLQQTFLRRSQVRLLMHQGLSAVPPGKQLLAFLMAEDDKAKAKAR
jgi:hypothetical protein